MELLVLNRQRGHPAPRVALDRFIRSLSSAYPPPQPGSLAVCLVSDRKIEELNRRYRSRPGPTDVLSFPGGEPEVDGEFHLGDIVISVATAKRQAHRHGHSLGRELKLLALHGYLHLLGYDHETDDGRMMRLQKRLERRLLPARKTR